MISVNMWKNIMMRYILICLVCWSYNVLAQQTTVSMNGNIMAEVERYVEEEIQRRIQPLIEDGAAKESRIKQLEDTVSSLEKKYLQLYKAFRSIKDILKKPTMEPTTVRSLTAKVVTTPTVGPPVGSPRLNRPVLDLIVTNSNPGIKPIYATALPGGGAAVYNYIRRNRTRQIVKINHQGETVRILYACQDCGYYTGMLLVRDDLFVLQSNGTIMKISTTRGGLLDTYQVDAGYLINTGSLSANPRQIENPDLLLLADSDRGHVFEYRLSTGEKIMRVTHNPRPVSVTYGVPGGAVGYIVCDSEWNEVMLFGRSWQLLGFVAKSNKTQTLLEGPESAIMSGDDTIFVVDTVQNRVSEFTPSGRFLRNVLTSVDGVVFPLYPSFVHPYLWIQSDGKIKRYRLY